MILYFRCVLLLVCSIFLYHLSFCNLVPTQSRFHGYFTFLKLCTSSPVLSYKFPSSQYYLFQLLLIINFSMFPVFFVFLSYLPPFLGCKSLRMWSNHQREDLNYACRTFYGQLIPPIFLILCSHHLSLCYLVSTLREFRISGCLFASSEPYFISHLLNFACQVPFLGTNSPQITSLTFISSRT